MLELLVTVSLGAFMLGMVTWHIARVVAEGRILESVRNRLVGIGLTSAPFGGSYLLTRGRVGTFFLDLFDCRLCLNTQVALVVTWAVLVVGLVTVLGEASSAVWALAFVVGPFLVAAWAELLRRLE